MLDFCETLFAQAHLPEGLAVNLYLGGEYGHGLTVTTVGVGAGDLALLYAELLGQGFLKTGAVQRGQRGELGRLEAGVDEGSESGDIGRVEDNYHELGVRAVLLDVVTEFGGNLAVALEEVLTGHALFTGRTAGGNNVLGTLESLCRVNGGREIDALEGAVVHLGQNALEARLENIVQADVGGKTEHGGRLGHVGANHAGCTDNEELFISKKLHDIVYFTVKFPLCARHIAVWRCKDTKFPGKICWICKKCVIFVPIYCND